MGMKIKLVAEFTGHDPKRSKGPISREEIPLVDIPTDTVDLLSRVVVDPAKLFHTIANNSKVGEHVKEATKIVIREAAGALAHSITQQSIEPTIVVEEAPDEPRDMDRHP